jgi:hypothetical protein
MNPALSGGGYQGITSGTGKERVTFHADASKIYYAVVDGKDMNQLSWFHVEVEACGACQPTASTTLSCNMSMAISGDTPIGKSALTTYMCGPGTPPATVAAAGNEQAFLFHTEADADQQVRATITNGSQPFTALALPVGTDGACDPTRCLASVNSSGAPGSATAVAVETLAAAPWLVRYWPRNSTHVSAAAPPRVTNNPPAKLGTNGTDSSASWAATGPR